MKKINLYWPIFKSLEKEVLALSNNIHFCDEQLNVYSIRIADLLIRISIELESIIKDLYRGEMLGEPSSPGKSLLKLNEMWLLDKKVVTLSAQSFYFSNEDNQLFAPFEYEQGKINDYYSAYNAVKHDRVKNISKANIRVLIHALASLFIANLYYKDIDEKYRLDRGGLTREIRTSFDTSRGSDTFSIKVATAAFPNRKPLESETKGYSGKDYSDSVYLRIVERATCEEEWQRIENNIPEAIAKISAEYHKKGVSLTSDMLNNKPLFAIARDAGGEAFSQTIAREIHPDIWGITPTIILNKSEPIYY